VMCMTSNANSSEPAHGSYRIGRHVLVAVNDGNREPSTEPALKAKPPPHAERQAGAPGKGLVHTLSEPAFLRHATTIVRSNRSESPLRKKSKLSKFVIVLPDLNTLPMYQRLL
jgi:hypothetical protein